MNISIFPGRLPPPGVHNGAWSIHYTTEGIRLRFSEHNDSTSDAYAEVLLSDDACARILDLWSQLKVSGLSSPRGSIVTVHHPEKNGD